MRVHIYADASVGQGCSTYGMLICWPDNPEIPHFESAGMIRHRARDNVTAEMAAVHHALANAIRLKYIAPGDRITMFSDSDYGVEWFSGRARTGYGKRQAARLKYDALAEEVRTMAREASVSIDVQWIKGHQPVGASVQADLHRRCDRLANRALRAALAPPSEPTPPPPIDHDRMRQDAAQKAAYQAKKAAKARAAMGSARHIKRRAFWEDPDWSGGDNLRDPGTNPFWMLAPAGRRLATKIDISE